MVKHAKLFMKNVCTIIYIIHDFDLRNIKGIGDDATTIKQKYSTHCYQWSKLPIVYEESGA